MNKISTKKIDDLFNDAWAEYEKLTLAVEEFCTENNIREDRIKVEMGGHYVRIKHTLPPKIWSEELHDKLCEAFDVHLNYFKKQALYATIDRPPMIIYNWGYSGTVHDEKYILDYKEALG